MGMDTKRMQHICFNAVRFNILQVHENQMVKFQETDNLEQEGTIELHEDRGPQSGQQGVVGGNRHDTRDDEEYVRKVAVGQNPCVGIAGSASEMSADAIEEEMSCRA